MTKIAPIEVAAARLFTAQHWPLHNEKQGIVWQQRDYALAEYDARHGYQRAFTCPDGRFHLSWHTYQKRL